VRVRSAQWRLGFQGLAEDVAHGRVGAIFGLEVARLARSSADCHRLLELCGLADVLIIDEQSVFTPRDFNDRLLLGLKGTMSEAELYWMRLRLGGAKLHQARRGALYFVPASGYAWDPGTARFRFDPDEQVQRALHLVFERFRLDGSAYGVARYFARHGLTLPARDLFLKVAPEARVCFLPIVAGFVGADAVAVTLATRMSETDEIRVAVDIGTNGEVILGSRAHLWACSAPAGPALEGAQIRHGMRGASGAIDRVTSACVA
jgi:DNA invertase Pin-like site-specific DNA recombinase